MKLSIGDVIDRWTIAYLKNARGKVDNIDEINTYIDYCNDNYDRSVIASAFQELLQHNGDIWLLESDIRLGKENELGLEEVGRRAIKIREINKLRIDVKNKINSHYKEGFVEFKVNHASE